ncbi:hypothetical protein QTP88_029345 [Uroleucon formosanum]
MGSLLETSDDETRDVGIQVDENKGAIVNITNKDIIKTEKINLNTPEGYHYSQEIDKEKYLKTIREKELLNKSVRSLSPASDSDSSIKRRTGLRTDKGVVHTELPITKRVRKPKDMSEMDIDKATTLIPVCTGAKNLSEFINTCDIAVKSVDKNNLPLLIKIINSKLAGNALEATKYRDTEKWEDIKSILKGAFEHRASERTLTIGLHFARMEENESVTSFASRVEELYYNLCTEGSKDMSEEESKVYKKQLKNQALIIFVNGLPKHLNLALKARDPKTLETAMQFAKDEEMEHNANLQMEKLTKNIKNQNLKGNNNTSGNNEQIEQMERDDIIEKSLSPFNAPLLLVKKKADASGKEKFRIVIDFRALNNVTINEFHPLPNITEILDQLGQSQLFSIVDLKSGYHQISLSKESRELTAFSTNQGHYHYKRMSMGLASAPSTFAKAMTNVMAGLIGHIISEHGIKPDPNKIVSVMNFPLGAILSQGKIGSDLPISYASRTLNNAELNYSTTELECLAIIFGVKHIRPYLYGRKFIILTDHRPLSWLFNLKDPLSKLARWRIELEQYNYEIKYKPGVQNSNVDALSRMYNINEIKEESYPTFLEKFETIIITNKNVKEVHGELLESPNEYHIVSEIEKYYNFTSGINYEIKKKFGKDKILKSNKSLGDVVKFKNENRYIIFLITKTKQKQCTTYETMHLTLLNLKYFCEKHNLKKLAMNQIGRSDGLEWAKVRSMIRYVFRNTNIEKLIIFKQFHDSKLGGHGGINRTLKKIKRQFNWPNLKQELKDYIKNCPSCQTNKNTNKHHRSPMVITSTSTKPFEKIFLDIVGPLIATESGNTYILTMMDDLSKYSLAVPLVNHTANNVAKAFVEGFVCVHGFPETILTDQGTDFLSKIFAEVCKLLKINKINSSPYHPQTNGSLERSHRTLAEYLRHYVDKDLNNWDTLLPYALFAYNTTIHTATNYQPYALVYGREIDIPVKLKYNPEPRYNYDDYIYDLKYKMQLAHQAARERLINRKIKSKKQYDKKEHNRNYNVGDLVLLKDNIQKNKLSPLWKGPYEVLDVLDTENITISRNRKQVTVHKNDVKKYYMNNNEQKI